MTLDGQRPAVERVARWDGAQWHPVGEGLTFSPVSMVIYDGEMWCDGWRFDGATWTEVATVDDSIRDTIVHDSRLILGGRFLTAGGVTSAFAGAWDGNQVLALPGLTDAISDLEIVGTDLFAVSEIIDLWRLRSGQGLERRSLGSRLRLGPCCSQRCDLLGWTPSHRGLPHRRLALAGCSVGVRRRDRRGDEPLRTERRPGRGR